MKKEQGEKRNTRAQATCVRFSDQELARIHKMKQATGMSFPILLKKALFSRMDLERPLFTREDADRILLELRRQGNNLTQIGKKVNSGIYRGWNQSYNNMMTAYWKLRETITVNHANR